MKAALILLPVVAGLVSWGGPFDLCGDGDGGGGGGGPEAKPHRERPAQRRVSGPVQAIAADQLCVTSGGLAPVQGNTDRHKAQSARGRVRRQVDGPKMRAVAPGSSGDVGELRFHYRGPTEKVAPLASGQIRRQVGLKLRAQDGCNLVYAMWRIDPKPGIEVQIKRNQGQRVNKECGNRGYRKLTPERSAPVPTLVPGSEHTLRAEITGQELVVWADGVVVWEGDLGPEVRLLAGPVGMRSDNVALDLELLAQPAVQTGSPAPGPGRCASVSDSE